MKIWQPSVISGLSFCLKERKTPDKTLETRRFVKMYALWKMCML